MRLAAGAERLRLRAAVLEQLLHSGFDGQPAVLSAAELLRHANFSNGAKPDLLALPIESLDGMREGIDSVALHAADPNTLADWLASARTHVTTLEAYKRHLLGRAWQNVRQKQKLQLLIDKLLNGTRAAVVIVDFKTKHAKNTELNERQSVHWDNSTLSIIGFVIIWFDGEAMTIRRKYVDYVSDDTTQDAIWTAAAFAEFAKDLAAFGFHEVHVHSDNGYHFHNNYVFSFVMPRFVRTLLLRLLSWQYCEPGEGKDLADGHFGTRAALFLLVLHVRSPRL